MVFQDCLSSSDANHLQEIEAAFESNEGGFLALEKVESFKLVELSTDGSIPQNAVFPIQDSRITIASILVRGLVELFRALYLENVVRKKLSAGLSEFLWPSEEGDTRVQFRSPVAGFPPCGQLRVVCSNGRGYGRRKKSGGEYCLAACDDGIVRWLIESDCVNENHVWTVRLFERRVGGVLYLRDELRRTEPNVYNDCVINTFIGGNVNASGTQTIGTVNCR